jgi:hypothetical protein
MGYQPEAQCDICGVLFTGETCFYKDFVLCPACFHLFEERDRQEVRRMPNVPWAALDGMLLASAGGLLLKTYGRLRG